MASRQARQRRTKRPAIVGNLARQFSNHGATVAVRTHRPGSRAERVQLWLRAAADKLGLKDWDIVFEPGKKPEGTADAEVRSSETQHARVLVNDKVFWKYPPEYQRLILTHELCHLHAAQFVPAVEALEVVLEKKIYRMASKILEDAEEHCVEAFARILALGLPLPSFGG